MCLSFDHEFVCGIPANDAKGCKRGKDPSKPVVADLKNRVNNGSAQIVAHIPQHPGLEREHSYPTYLDES
jgi:hypothetical protein